MSWLADRLPSYPVALAVLSLAVALAELLRPWRPEQRGRYAGLVGDLAFLVWNGHVLGVLLYAIARRWLAPPLEQVLDATHVRLGLAAAWPLWAQLALGLVVLDFIQWGTHRLLHAVPWLWTFHKIHHSVVDGEMSYIVSFRFHWVEAVLYKSLQYLPLLLLGISTSAVFLIAVFGTLVGHLNHANLDLGRGPLRYVFNSPRMHLWHHDYDVADGVKNFGIVFSAWDWIFGTAYMPAHEPRALGFAGVEEVPRHFLGRLAWPLWRA